MHVHVHTNIAHYLQLQYKEILVYQLRERHQPLLGKDYVEMIDKDKDKHVDLSESGKTGGLAGRPHQVRAKDYGEVGRGHFVDFFPCSHLDRRTKK